MLTRSILVIGLLSYIINACATFGPSAEQLKRADYGEYPENYQEMFRTADVTAPEKCWVTLDTDPPEYLFGYRVQVRFERTRKVLRTESEPVDTPTGTVIRERKVWDNETYQEGRWYFIRNGKVYKHPMRDNTLRQGSPWESFIK